MVVDPFGRPLDLGNNTSEDQAALTTGGGIGGDKSHAAGLAELAAAPRVATLQVMISVELFPSIAG